MKPALILQMQRMGDLVLTFPLLGWLRAEQPARPLWVVGEAHFFDPLLPLSPTASYFSYECLPNLARQEFSQVINLSHRPEAASIAGRARGEALTGPWLDSEGRLFINGDWQLYRASLTHNNACNLFHWADLNGLDTIRIRTLKRTHWPGPKAFSPAGDGTDSRPAGPRQARVGLFLGASEADKRPEPAFWAGLAALLLERGLRPVLLGGPEERNLGRAVSQRLGSHALNLTGRFSVSELARFLGELDLLITPDTGPMHIAAWVGTPVLNLSMGPVNPWETGPTPPGHYVLRSALDCSPCWQCHRERPLCKELFTPEKVCAVAGRLCSARPEAALARLRGGIEGLELLRSARDELGLYRLDSLSGKSGRDNHLALFWRAWFASLFKLGPEDRSFEAAKRLAGHRPALFESLREAAALCLADMARQATRGLTWSANHWRESPPVLRPFTGYVQMYVDNASGNRAALSHCLDLTERLARTLADC